MYKMLSDIQTGFSKVKDRYIEVDEPDTHKGFRQALWWVLHDED